ncbi:hypothetical protein [uncultured Nostoc sp.]|uniref:hypothetical protein n=1 Tax=uncultured Nostoc sp. TaxID=340711 RepID=UPI00263906F6|nr:hypothetical protein [uncultured Nostoc sp.]
MSQIVRRQVARISLRDAAPTTWFNYFSARGWRLGRSYAAGFTAALSTSALTSRSVTIVDIAQ